MGMNKYGLAAEKKGDKFISYKDGKVTGEFDPMEELKNTPNRINPKTNRNG